MVSRERKQNLIEGIVKMALEDARKYLVVMEVILGETESDWMAAQLNELDSTRIQKLHDDLLVV